MLTSRRRTNYPGVLAIQENLNHSIEHEINRGYHMVARRYKVYVRVLKNTNCWNIFQHEKRTFCISKLLCKVLFIKTPMKYQAISLQHFLLGKARILMSPWQRRSFTLWGNQSLTGIPFLTCLTVSGFFMLFETLRTRFGYLNASDRPRFYVSRLLIFGT